MRPTFADVACHVIFFSFISSRQPSSPSNRRATTFYLPPLSFPHHPTPPEIPKFRPRGVSPTDLVRRRSSGGCRFRSRRRKPGKRRGGSIGAGMVPSTLELAWLEPYFQPEPYTSFGVNQGQSSAGGDSRRAGQLNPPNRCIRETLSIEKRDCSSANTPPPQTSIKAAGADSNAAATFLQRGMGV